jgi:TonB family protein
MRKVLFVFIILLFNLYSMGQVKQSKDTVPFSYIDDTELYVYFPGGKDGPSSDTLLNRYIRENLNYPDSAKKAGIEGWVYVSFAIDKIGKISDIEIVKGLSPDINREVIRMIAQMPDWTWYKAIDIKKRKKIKRTLPIKFCLQ